MMFRDTCWKTVDERISVDDDESKIRQIFCSLLLTSNKGQKVPDAVMPASDGTQRDNSLAAVS
jgi:hypothetical protein